MERNHGVLQNILWFSHHFNYVYLCLFQPEPILYQKRKETEHPSFFSVNPFQEKQYLQVKLFHYLHSHFLFLQFKRLHVIGIMIFDNGTINWETYINSIQWAYFNDFFWCVGLLISMLSKPKMNFMGLVVGVVFTCFSSMPSPNLLMMPIGLDIFLRFTI